MKRIISSAVVLFLLLMILFFSTRAILMQAEAESREFLHTANLSTAQSVRLLIEGDFQTLEALANFSGALDTFSVKALLPILKNECEKHSMNRMGLILPDGTATGVYGSHFDCSDTEYFKAAMRGETYISPSMQERFYRANCNVYATPVYQKGELVGIIFATRPSAEFRKRLNESGLGKLGNAYLINSEGKEVLNREEGLSHTGEDTALNVIEDLNFVGGANLEQVKADLQAGKQGGFQYKDETGSLRYGHYAPIGVSDWYVLSILSKSIASVRAQEYKKIVIFMGLGIVFVMLLFSGITIAEQKRYNAIVNKANAKLSMITANLQGAVTQNTLDDGLTLQYMSEGLLRMTGFTREEIRDRFGDKLTALIAPDDVSTFEEHSKLKLLECGAFEQECHLQRKDGGIRPVSVEGVLSEDEEQGDILYCTITDITERQNMLQALVKKTDEIMLGKMIRDIAMVNSGFTSFLYFPKEKRLVIEEPLPGLYEEPQSLTDIPQRFFELGLVDAEYMDVVCQAYERINQGEPKVTYVCRSTLSDGTIKWKKVILTAVSGEETMPEQVIGILQDITREKERENLLEAAAEIDQMTGLYNKAATEALIKEQMNHLREGELSAMFVMDIDDFKCINDNLGHLYGDVVITELAGLMKSLFRTTDVLGRIGGDEFMVFMKNARTKDMVEQKAQELCNTFRTIFAGENLDFAISVSMGIAICEDSQSFLTLYQKADEALYTVKKSGKGGYLFYSEK